MEIQGIVNIGKYARLVIYYWTLCSVSKALAISLQKREKYLLFVQRKNTTKQEAVNLKLTTWLVETGNG